VIEIELTGIPAGQPPYPPAMKVLSVSMTRQFYGTPAPPQAQLNCEKFRLEGRSSLEIGGDRRIDSSHAGLIGEDEPQFAVLTQ
jgi:hypothetical protein